MIIFMPKIFFVSLIKETHQTRKVIMYNLHCKSSVQNRPFFLSGMVPNFIDNQQVNIRCLDFPILRLFIYQKLIAGGNISCFICRTGCASNKKTSYHLVAVNKKVVSVDTFARCKDGRNIGSIDICLWVLCRSVFKATEGFYNCSVTCACKWTNTSWHSWCTFDKPVLRKINGEIQRNCTTHEPECI